jgi:hypothetical protein
MICLSERVVWKGHFWETSTSITRMASLDDYDEFGNYIGQDLDSDDEDEPTFVPQQQAAPLEGFDEDEPMQEPEDNALMQIDGRFQYIRPFLHS